MSFIGSLATKCVSLNSTSCITRPMLIDFNLIELNYYPFMVSLDKSNRSCNAFDDLSTKLCVLSNIKNEDAKTFSIITRWK